MKLHDTKTLINLGYMKLEQLRVNTRKRMEGAFKRHALITDSVKQKQLEDRVMFLNDQLFEIMMAIDILKRTQGGYMPFVDKNGKPFTLYNNGEPVYIGFN